MSKYAGVIAGGVEIAGGIAAFEFGGAFLAAHGLTALAPLLIASGPSTQIGGLGTLLRKAYPVDREDEAKRCL